MGGISKLFSAPKAPELPKPDMSEEKAAADRREEAIRRAARGRAGLIATGPRGLLASVTSGAKKLLGE